MVRIFSPAILLCLLLPIGIASAESSVDFVTDVKPILADACFHCHGPDEESREGGLRLDVAEDAADVLSHDPDEVSELIARVTHEDPDLLMPPPDSGKSLSAEQIETLRQWIHQGAEFAEHWAFAAPKRPAVPSTKLSNKINNPIDAFVAAKLDEVGWLPSERAKLHTLVRRLSLDLTGLPPEPADVRSWVERLQQDGDAAYERLVDQLLRSPHFGERWARLWLDAARYADSDGYEKDKPREAWFYRRWVIDSFNADRPYDEFVVRQIAGDLLPGAEQSDHVATGFLRNSMINEEGGADPEQFRMEAMFDRMDAIGKSILGLTIQCAQCHSHKYDPLAHEEYYGLFAFLNNTHDAIIPAYTQEQQRLRDETVANVAAIEQQIRSAVPDWKSQLTAWADDLRERQKPTWQTPPLEFLDRTLGGQKFLPQEDGSYLCQGYAPTNFKPQMTGRYSERQLTGLRLELLTHPNLPRAGPGRSVEGTWALSEITATVSLASDPDTSTTLKFKRAVADRSPDKRDLKPRYDNKKKQERILGGIDFAIDGKETTAWTNDIGPPRANEPQVAWFELETPFEIPAGDEAIVVVHLAQRHGGWNSDDNQTINIGCFRLSMTADPIPESEPLPPAVAEVLDRPRDQWRDADWDTLFSHWRTTRPEFAEYNQSIEQAWQAYPLAATQLTLAECDSPRVTSLLNRGDFLSPVKAVVPHVPEFLHPLPESEEPPRLRFARWLVSRDAPTTARSIVNRIWQAYFGVGLVETSDDLGTQSTPPSHPHLLDYLAVELMDSGWSLKHLHRLIVRSATYQQSSETTPEQFARDPYNRLLARGARFRVSAETVRDISLAASGLLSTKIGGPSVYPPAPEFLFQPPASYGPKVWNVATGQDRYRRALYTFRFRSVPYPMLENFDAVPGNVACVRRTTSNTPMQALTSLNEPVFLECSIALGAKTLREKELSGDRERVGYLFERCVQRPPEEAELGVLIDYLAAQRDRLTGGELSAEDILSAGESLDTEALAADELAAWTLLARVVLNLDETITRE